MDVLRTAAEIACVAFVDSAAKVLVEASNMLHDYLCRHVEEAEYLADEDGWSEEQVPLVRDLICELAMIVRHVLGGHRANENAQCQSCERAWPCSVVVTVHRLVKDPEHQFVKLIGGTGRAMSR